MKIPMHKICKQQQSCDAVGSKSFVRMTSCCAQLSDIYPLLHTPGENYDLSIIIVLESILEN